MSRRSGVAIAVVVLLGAIVILGRWYQGRRALPHRSAGSSVVGVTRQASRRSRVRCPAHSVCVPLQ